MLKYNSTLSSSKYHDWNDRICGCIDIVEFIFIKMRTNTKWTKIMHSTTAEQFVGYPLAVGYIRYLS